MQSLRPDELCRRWKINAETLRLLAEHNLVVPEMIAGQQQYPCSLVEAIEARQLHEHAIEQVMLSAAAERGIEAAAELLGVDAGELAAFVQESESANTESGTGRVDTGKPQEFRLSPGDLLYSEPVAAQVEWLPGSVRG